MAPDERAVRSAYERSAQLSGGTDLPRTAVTVLIEPVTDQQLWTAEVRLADLLTQPVRARAHSPDLAVQRAFDRLHARARLS